MAQPTPRRARGTTGVRLCSRVPPEQRAMLRTPFASWGNRFVRAYASEHGCGLRVVSAEPDLLEPCHGIPTPNTKDNAK
jgi:hypothetical protein